MLELDELPELWRSRDTSNSDIEISHTPGEL